MYLKCNFIWFILVLTIPSSLLYGQARDKLLHKIDHKNAQIKSLEETMDLLANSSLIGEELETLYKTYLVTFPDQQLSEVSQLFFKTKLELDKLAAFSLKTNLDSVLTAYVHLRRDVLLSNNLELMEQRYTQIAKKCKIDACERRLKMRISLSVNKMLKFFALYLTETANNFDNPAVMKNEDRIEFIKNIQAFFAQINTNKAVQFDYLFDKNYQVLSTLIKQDVIDPNKYEINLLFKPYSNMLERLKLSNKVGDRLYKNQLNFLHNEFMTKFTLSGDELERMKFIADSIKKEAIIHQGKASVAETVAHLANVEAEIIAGERIKMDVELDSLTNVLKRINSISNHASQELSLSQEELAETMKKLLATQSEASKSDEELKSYQDKLRLAKDRKSELNKEIDNIKEEKRALSLENDRLETSQMYFLSSLVGLLMLGLFLLATYSKKLRHKNLLLKATFHELHHRTGNNLRMVSAMLGLQAQSLIQPKAQDALFQAQDRLTAIGIVHRRLYQVDSISKVKIAEYVNDLVEELQRSFEFDKALLVKMEIDDIVVDGDTATHLGVLINEVVTNAFKHAFQENSEPQLSISMSNENKNINLYIKDNGLGIPEGVNPLTSKTFGMKIIRLMVEEQMDGRYHFFNENGTHFIANLKLK